MSPYHSQIDTIFIHHFKKKVNGGCILHFFYCCMIGCRAKTHGGRNDRQALEHDTRGEQ